ncbi:MAG: hypothetical protein AAF628_09815 [Planctomycetota bacterium]
MFVHRGDTDNRRHVNGGAILRMASVLLEARTGSPDPDAAMGSVLAAPFANPGPVPPELEALALDSAVAEQVAGDYELAPDMLVTVHVYDDRLFARTRDGEAELFCAGGYRFFARAVQLQIEFEVADGRATGLRGELMGRPMRARRR